MSRPLTPQIKLAEVNDRRPPQPGPNSWAQSAKKAGKMKVEKPGIPTNRDKYENKPMPPLPKTPEQGKSPNAPGKPGYIQPATPLIYSNPTPSKNRAVTDPITSKNLLSTNKVSIGELRRKFSGTKQGANLSSIEENANVRSRAPKPQAVELPTGSSISGGSHGKRHENPPASAPPSTNTKDPFRSSGTQGPEHQSSPVPTRRYMRENQYLDPAMSQTSTIVSSYEDLEIMNKEAPSPDGIIMGDGKLNPTRNGTYGTIGEVEYVEGEAAHRVASFTGVIENASSPNEPEVKIQSHSTNNSASTGTFQGQNITHLLDPNTYSPSNYGGVWENDPNVGHTLPPFSPMHPYRPFQPELQHKNSSLGSRGTVPFTPNQERIGQPSRLSAYPPSVASTNSWATQMQEPPNSATVPPLFSNVHNAVPPPPPTYRDYQPPVGQVPPELARIELTLHHHLDSCFGSLSRLVTDKHDNTVDHLLRRLESHERKLENSQKSLKSDIKNIKGDAESLKADIRHLQQSSEELQEYLKCTDVKLETMASKLNSVKSQSGSFDQAIANLSASVQDIRVKCDRIAEQTGRNSSASQPHQQHPLPSPTRSQSTSASPGLQSQRQGHQSGTSQTSGGARHSETNSRGRRSNTAGGGIEARSSDGQSSRRQYYTEMGAAMGVAPDLRQHPAYLSQQQNYGYDANAVAMGMSSDGTIYQIPSFAGHGPNGWYQQAYGQS